MAEMAVGDVQQKLEGSVLMYKNKPYLFQRFNGNDVRAFDLLEQKESIIAFDEKEWVAPVPRIGMVNCCGSVFYATRVPVRRYKLGLSTENLQVDTIHNAVYPDKGKMFRDEIRGLRSKFLGETLLRKYPSLRDALIRVTQFEGTVAFDKQFAVDSNLNLFYKRTKVGTHDGNSIRLDAQHQHLSILIKE